MSNVATARPRSKRTYKAPPRSIAWVEQPVGPGEWGGLEITVGKATEQYAVREIVSEIGGRGFEVEKLDGTTYHVLMNPDGSGTCDCMGHERHGHCKHREGLHALVRAGRFPLLPLPEVA